MLGAFTDPCLIAPNLLITVSFACFPVAFLFYWILIH